MRPSTAKGGATSPTSDNEAPLSPAGDSEQSSPVDLLSPAQEHPSLTQENAREVEAQRRAEAFAVEIVAIKAIDAAMVARQAAEAQSGALERARSEAVAAAQKAARCSAAVDKASAAKGAAVEAAEEAKKAIGPAIAERERAEHILSNGAQAAEAAAAATAAARFAEREALLKVRDLEKTLAQLADKVSAETQAVKAAKRESEDVGKRSAEASAIEREAFMAITEAQKVLDSKRALATDAANKAYMLREEMDEKNQAMETAARAAEEAEGGERDWEVKTQERFKAREMEFKHAQQAAEKALKAEKQAESAENEAAIRLSAVQDEHRAQAEVANKEEAAAKYAAATVLEKVDAVERAHKAHDEMLKQIEEAKDQAKVCEFKVEEAIKAEEETTVERAQEAAARARDGESKAKSLSKELSEVAEVKARALVAVEEELAAAVASEASKRELVDKASEKDRFAESKEEVADSAVVELRAQILGLALARLLARHVDMTEEEAAQAAEAASRRRVQAGKEHRGQGSKSVFAELSTIDKWSLWRQRAEIAQMDAVWNVRRLFYNTDGSIKSSLDLLVSDIVGTALDLGPISPKHCQILGDGIHHASIGQVANFTIIACNAQGTRFEEGGATFQIGLRFAGQGMRVRAKIVDNEDGSYTVSFKPTSTGKCNITLSYLGEPLLGSPFVCAVSAPTPCAPQCEAHGEALQRVVAHREETFYVSFRDALGNLAHACELDVWVEPVNSDAGVRLPTELDQLQKPLGAFESLMVGPNGLDVQSSQNLDSERIARLPPGRALRLLKTPQTSEDGTVRACVALELEDREVKESSTWRELWPSQQDWRTLSWREHIDEVREQEEAKAMALAMELEMQRHKAATRIQAQKRRRIALQYIEAYKVQLREEAEAAIAEAAAKAARAEKGKRKGGVSKAASQLAKASSRGKNEKDGGEGAKAPSPVPTIPATKAAPTAKPLSPPKAADKPAAAKHAEEVIPQDEPAVNPKASSTSDGRPAAKSDTKAAVRDPSPKVPRGEVTPKSAKSEVNPKASSTSDLRVAAKKLDTKAAMRDPSPKVPRGEVTPKSAKSDRKSSSKGTPPGSDRRVKKSTDKDAGDIARMLASEEKQKAATKIQAARRAQLVRRRNPGERENREKEDTATGAPSTPKPTGTAQALETDCVDASTPTTEEMPLKPKPAKSASSAKKGKKKAAKTAADIEREEAEARAAAEAEALAIAQAEEAERQAALEAIRQAELAAVRAALARSAERQRSREAQAEAKSKVQQEQAESFSPIPSSRRSARGSPRLKLGKLRHADVGWVTLAANGESLVSKRTAQLPPHMRQQHLQHWTRRVALDSERERTRALERDRNTEDETARSPGRSPGRNIPHSRSPPTTTAYSSEIASDPKGVGFAYGGLYPGRLHAKGRLIDQHEVRFSVAKVGKYLLYVSLHGHQPARSTNRSSSGESHIPGSPFMLVVSPGRAHPLSTKLELAKKPLRGVLITEDKGKEDKATASADPPRWQCSLNLVTRDKMGNACDSGGADVTCGFLLSPAAVMEEASTMHSGPENASGTHQASGNTANATLRKSAPVKRLEDESSCTDNGDGTYSLRWATGRVGMLNIFVKIDGLHVMGSPASLLNVAPRPVAVVSAPAAAAAKPDPKARLRSRRQIAEAPAAEDGQEGSSESPLRRRRSSAESQERRTSAESQERRASTESEERRISVESQDRQVSVETQDRQVSAECEDRRVSAESALPVTVH